VSELSYGVSITDACLGWEATERMLRWAKDQFAERALTHATVG
jgi:phospho-2-dehydro-3-deoxyheptonate aldolase